jgi:hypothetical protein
MNRAINSAAAQKRCVRPVNYGVHIKFSDVASNDVDLAIFGFLHKRS